MPSCRGVGGPTEKSHFRTKAASIEPSCIGFYARLGSDSTAGLKGVNGVDTLLSTSTS